MKYKFLNKESVQVKAEYLGHEKNCFFHGKIVGCSSTEMPVIGRMWLVELTVMFDDYPFSVVTVPELAIVRPTL